MGEERAERLAAAVAERDLDALLVTDLVNLRYVTGFTGTNGLAVVGAGADGARVFVTDFRYVERAEEEAQGFERRRGARPLRDGGAAGLPGGGPLLFGFDDAPLPVRRHRELGAALGDDVELVPAGGMVEDLRRGKEPGGGERIRAP